MFDTAKTFYSGGDGGGDGSGEIGGGAGGQNIFDVVLAAKLNIAEAGEFHFRALVPENDLVVAEERAGGDSFLAAEPENFGLGRHAFRDFRVVRVQQGDVFFELIFEHAHFGVRIFLEGEVAIEMIGSQIQEHADFGAKRIDGFELKAADFGDGHGDIDRGFDQRQQRRADVAADERGNI